MEVPFSIFIRFANNVLNSKSWVMIKQDTCTQRLHDRFKIIEVSVKALNKQALKKTLSQFFHAFKLPNITNLARGIHQYEN